MPLGKVGIPQYSEDRRESPGGPGDLCEPRRWTRDIAMPKRPWMHEPGFVPRNAKPAGNGDDSKDKRKTDSARGGRSGYACG